MAAVEKAKEQTHKGRVNMESLLDKIDQPSDLKKLNAQQVEKLCAEIRHFMLENISKTGGHLASNLGTVELTVALHRVLETPKDKIVFDVGHQCYTHKLLTGRRKQFDHLRQLDGISGFPNPNESVHDAFIAGHGNTALSLAIGMAWAKKIKHEPGLVVALIGDGAFTGGMVYEGMNNIGGLDNLLVILNDNKMSISKNVGALARYLTHLRTTTAYYDAKDNVRSFLDGVPLIGPPMKKSLMGAKTLVRRAMYHSTMFEDMGFEYIGPVDGHNVEELERTLRSIYQRPGPHFLHVVTKKGKGYQPAEMNPGNYHGVSAFDPDGMPDPEVAPKESFSTVFGKLLVQEGTQNPKLCAITAAMKYGTGLQFFAHRHPQRFFYKVIILTCNRIYSLWLFSGWFILKCTYLFTGTALDTFFCINFRVYKSVFIFFHVDCSLRTYIHTRPTATTILLFRK